MPVQPYPNSSAIKQPSNTLLPIPPTNNVLKTVFVYILQISLPISSGMWPFVKPTDQAFLIISQGYFPVLSYSAATGIISSFTNFLANSWNSFWVSLSSLKTNWLYYTELLLINISHTETVTIWWGRNIAFLTGWNGPEPIP